ncbi:RNA polymerase sigma factor SigJ [Phytohabitans houttuyneae]|uniref:DNA-directed RNA polymerase sigma-70 factor n=1 Tax=Phytohabitans houttuyneae TaxID=1076126 RepID=A0A6V8KJ20_9ACTN|nr:RNA polymerase sigma factor SigJ [Phytohabitans houttuyneae]GFJ82438.1 DNA-directed RNA polymerase sigma-70 factor [Phytohabitans houttuyneae]
MDDEQAAGAFEEHRAHLTGVAYRMLGTLADAEDAVQEAYLRFARTDIARLRDVRAWLTTTVARICLDELGSARARRESYVGPWLPEPVVDAAALGPEDRVTLDDSVSMAMLVLLESLSPAERTAFILREVMGLPYPEVALTVGRAEAACRQLVARARAHVRRNAPRFTVDQDQHAGAVRAFLAACAGGRMDALVRVLDPDVVLRSDGGGQVAGVARRPVVGADRVARLLVAVAARGNARPDIRSVNGAPGLVFEAGGRVVGVMAFSVAGDLITGIDFVVNPDKLTRIPTEM